MGMRRRIIGKVAALLLLGAIINAAVAWGCMFWLHGLNFSPPRSPTQSELVIWATQKPKHFSQSLEAIKVNSAFGHQVRHFFGDVDGLLNFSTADTPIRGETSESAAETRLGWPMHSVSGIRWTIRWAAGGQQHISSRLYRYKNSSGRSPAKSIPYGLLWPGFAINTIFYAAILWMLFAVPGAVRRRVRIKRGQCVRCAYDLRGRGVGTQAGTCPECGTKATTIA